MKNLKRNRSSGFAMLEVMLSLMVIGLAGYGTYSLYVHSQQTEYATQFSQEMQSIASAFSGLENAGLTGGMTTSTTFIQGLYNTQRLSTAFFSMDDSGNPTKLTSVYGRVIVTSPTASGYTLSVTVPFNQDNNQAQSICRNVQDDYSRCTVTTRARWNILTLVYGS